MAADMYDQSEPVMLKARERKTGGSGVDWRARAEAAEAKVEELTKRLQAAEAALVVAQRGSGMRRASFRMSRSSVAQKSQRSGLSVSQRTSSSNGLLRMMGLGKSSKNLSPPAMNGVGQVNV